MKKMYAMGVEALERYDLIVVGGGFAGAAAALAAARSGSSVLLIEKGNSLGGAAANCLVNPFMRYWTRVDGARMYLSAGIFAEIHKELEARGAMSLEQFLEEDLKLILNRMLLAAGVELLFHAYLCDVVQKEGRITGVSVATREGVRVLEASYFIDATGDAQVAYLAGCPTTLGREPDHLCQPMTLCFRVGNVDVERFMESKERLQEAYKATLAAGGFQNPRENILVFRTPISNVLHFNTTRVVLKNPTSAVDITQAEILAREQVFEVYDFMRKHADGLENSFLMMTAAEIGVRESRMIVGAHVLTETECRACTKFPDAIAACNYDIDIHNPEGSGTSHYYFPDGTYYTIPYRSLIPQGVENLLVAGRCISSDHGAQASYRIMPVVCCLGEAAGTAVGIAKMQGCAMDQIDIATLQKRLKQNGAFLGIEL